MCEPTKGLPEFFGAANRQRFSDVSGGLFACLVRMGFFEGFSGKSRWRKCPGMSHIFCNLQHIIDVSKNGTLTICSKSAFDVSLEAFQLITKKLTGKLW